MFWAFTSRLAAGQGRGDEAPSPKVGKLITITGGKVTTFRLMAEDTVDLLVEKMGSNEPSRTAEQPLPRA